MSLLARVQSYITRKRLTRELADLVSDEREGCADFSDPLVFARARDLLAGGADPNGKKHIVSPLVYTGQTYGAFSRRSIFSRSLTSAPACRLLVDYGARLDNDTLEEAINLVNDRNRFTDDVEPVRAEQVAILLEMARAPVSTARLDKRYPDLARKGYVEEDYLRPALDILKDRVPGFAALFDPHQLQAQLEADTPLASASAHRPRRL